MVFSMKSFNVFVFSSTEIEIGAKCLMDFGHFYELDLTDIPSLIQVSNI